ncbi:hypothetical protein B4135_3378 [Caldibacillus debilis]|uniref:Uncharacterized protein n=1 Tax=Caldibacillus debilis TaxID=301148 RepID=A0A150LE11_9BACI|nr:hypothetical protein B4135_3378 [Caldibacillus debilis]
MVCPFIKIRHLQKIPWRLIFPPAGYIINIYEHMFGIGEGRE